jgi:flagellin
MLAADKLTFNTGVQSADIERLSTGMRINSAADDAAGLVRSQQMTAELSGLAQASSNTNDAINLTKTAEAALNEEQNLLMTMRQLAVQASNAGVNDTETLTSDQAQITSAIQSINRISTTTQFGTKKLLDGSATAATTTTITGVGTPTTVSTGGSALTIVTTGDWSLGTAGNYTSATVNPATASSETYTASAPTTGGHYSGTLFGVNIGTLVNVGTINSLIASQGYQMSESGNDVIFTRTTPGPTPATPIGVFSFNMYKSNNTPITYSWGPTSSTVGTNQSLSLNGGANSGYTSSSTTDNGDGTTNYTFDNGAVIKAQTSAGTVNTTLTATAGTPATSISTKGKDLVFQIGASSGQTTSLSIQSTAADQIGQNAPTYKDAVGATQTVGAASIADINVTTFKGAQDAIVVIDKAISDISTIRAALGAYQTNVLQSAGNSLLSSQQNLTDSKSAITDTDLALTVVKYTRDQILVQSSTTALSYANQQPQSILKLLQ